MNNANFLRARKQMSILARHLFLIAILIVVLYPVVYIAAVAFDPNERLTGRFPENFTWDNMRYVVGIDNPKPGENLEPSKCLLWLWNSVKVSGITAILMVLLSTSSAYALSRFNFKHRNTALLALMLLQMFPAVMSIVAFFLILNWLGNLIPWMGNNTHAGLILVYLGGIPFNIWLIKGYFDTLPKSVEEAAILDGCTPFQCFYKIVIPLSTPILSVVAILTFIGTYSDFILPSILLRDQELYTFAVGIQNFATGRFESFWGKFCSACLLGALPISAMFMAVHRYIVSGLSAGATKG